MKILLTNDDGIYADGLKMLSESLKDLAELQIVAPDRDCSGVSNSLSLTVPLRIKHLNENTICVEGTPTDCVHMALTGLIQNPPDIVISGINSGSNLGDDVLYSGTVAAAMEGRNLGYPAIAISLIGYEQKHYETACMVVKNLLHQLTVAPLSSNTILNINVPDVPFDQLNGIEVTRLGARHKAEPVIPATDQRGRPIYWIGPAGKEQDAGEGTDFFAVANRKVSITPIHVDLTHYAMLDSIREWVDQVNWRE
jgi:5'-nucleotidase